MSKELFLIVSAAFVVLLVAAGMLGWSIRRRRQSDIPPPPGAPKDFTPTVAAEVLYVATTKADDDYDRVVVHGLGLRTRARVLVGEAGILLELPDRAVFTSRACVRRVQRATWTIDRAVEPGGLLRYAWQLGDHEVATNIRVVGDDSDILEALLRLQPGDTAGATPAGRQQ